MVAGVFISHTDADRELADEVLGWLVEDGHQAFLDHDVRAGLAAGEGWEQRLHERLRWADAVVCVVSAAYVASAWCAAEVGIASSRGSRLLPLRAEPGVTHPILTAVQHTDLGDRDQARERLREALARSDASGGQGWPDGRCPFPGLRPFGAELHRVFFGRAGEVQDLVGMLRSPAARADAQMIVVVGPSGCGKSSLVRAGVLPVMAREPGWWTLPAVLPGADPVAALARELTGTGRRLGLRWTLPDIHRRLAAHDGRTTPGRGGRSAPSGLAEVAEELLLAAPGGWDRRRLLVVLDQAEELLTLAPSQRRAHLAGLLGPAMAGPVQVVATVRPEFLDPLLAVPELAQLPVRLFALRPLRRPALPAVIEEPARLAGIAVGAELVARLADDTGSGEALPLLAFALEQLAAGVDRGGQLSPARYEELGGVRGALVRQADAALADAVSAGGRTERDVIAGLLRVVTVDEQGRPTRSRIRRAELPEPARGEMDAFVTRRLLTTDTVDDAVVLGVAHEAFLSVWPPLAEAISSAAVALRVRRAVEQAATGWDAAGRPRTRLWERGHLAAAVNDLGARQPSRSWAVPRRGRTLVTDAVDVSPSGREFLQASVHADRRRRARATTVLSVLLALAVAAAGLALNRQRAADGQRREARQQQRIAAVRQLVALADNARATDPRTAMLLGVAAERLRPSGETRAGLVNTLIQATHYAATLPGHAGWVRTVAYSPDGRVLATGGDDGNVLLWDTSSADTARRLGRPLPGYSNVGVSAVAFSPAGKILAVAGFDGTVILWEVSDRHAPRRLGRPLTGHGQPVEDVAFSPDGRTLATAGADYNTILWDMSDHGASRRPGRPLADSGIVLAVAFSPDGRTLVTGTEESATLWDVSDRRPPRRLGQPLTSDISRLAVAFAPVGNLLATGGHDGTVTLWDVSHRDAPRRLGRPLTAHPGEATAVAFSPDGRTLATGGTDDTVQLWDLSNRRVPRRLGRPLTGHTGTVYAVEFKPDGRSLASASADGTAIRWDLSDRAAPRRSGVSTADMADKAVREARNLLGGPAGLVRCRAVSPDGKTVALGTRDKTLIVVDVPGRNALRRPGMPLTGHTGDVTAMAFSPDGRTLATADSHGEIIMWDLSDHASTRRLGGMSTGQLTMTHIVVFSPDGRTLAAGDRDTVALWDVSDRRTPRRLSGPLAGHTNGIDTVAFGPDGRTLATGGGDNTVLLWDVSNRNAPQRLGRPLTGHSAAVDGVVFSQDGRTLATSGLDETVILWDLSDRSAPRRLGLPLHWTPFGSGTVAFSPDGRALTVDADRWDLAGLDNLRNAPADRACAVMGRGLDRAEWDRYLPGIPYEKTCTEVG